MKRKTKNKVFQLLISYAYCLFIVNLSCVSLSETHAWHPDSPAYLTGTTHSGDKD